MRFLICGTAAAEGWPALFCACEACAVARTRGGRDIRTRAAYMLGDRVRIDWGPDSHFHMQRHGLAYERLTHLLVTHSHWDHWVPEELGYRRRGFSRVADGNVLQIFGNAHVRARAEAALREGWDAYSIEFHDLRPWEPIPLPDEATAIPVLAAHDRSQECVNFLIEAHGRRLLQGHDTGWWPDVTWEFLASNPLDIVLFDSTTGKQAGRGSHLGAADVVAARENLAKLGALRTGARVIATHFSHNGGWLHEQLVEYFTPHGIEVAYDGMEIELADREASGVDAP